MMAFRLLGNLSPKVFLYHLCPLSALGPMTQRSTNGKRKGGVERAVANISLAPRWVKMGRE